MSDTAEEFKTFANRVGVYRNEEGECNRGYPKDLEKHCPPLQGAAFIFNEMYVRYARRVYYSYNGKRYEGPGEVFDLTKDDMFRALITNFLFAYAAGTILGRGSFTVDDPTDNEQWTELIKSDDFVTEATLLAGSLQEDQDLVGEFRRYYDSASEQMIDTVGLRNAPPFMAYKVWDMWLLFHGGVCNSVFAAGYELGKHKKFTEDILGF